MLIIKNGMYDVCKLEIKNFCFTPEGRIEYRIDGSRLNKRIRPTAACECVIVIDNDQPILVVRAEGCNSRYHVYLTPVERKDIVEIGNYLYSETKRLLETEISKIRNLTTLANY